MAKSRKVSESTGRTVDFNVWFALREKKIPANHLREIIWADFKAQGCLPKESLSVFDEALANYGISL